MNRWELLLSEGDWQVDWDRCFKLRNTTHVDWLVLIMFRQEFWYKVFSVAVTFALLIESLSMFPRFY